MIEREGSSVPEDPTVEADEAEPTEPGPGDSEGARPEPDEDEGGGDGGRG